MVFLIFQISRHFPSHFLVILDVFSQCLHICISTRMQIRLRRLVWSMGYVDWGRGDPKMLSFGTFVLYVCTGVCVRVCVLVWLPNFGKPWPRKDGQWDGHPFPYPVSFSVLGAAFRLKDTIPFHPLPLLRI